MTEQTKARILELIAAHEQQRDSLLNQANWHDGAAAALRGLLAPPPDPAPAPADPT